jgi:hypothetical protein
LVHLNQPDESKHEELDDGGVVRECDDGCDDGWLLLWVGPEVDEGLCEDGFTDVEYDPYDDDKDEMDGCFVDHFKYDGTCDGLQALQVLGHFVLTII